MDKVVIAPGSFKGALTAKQVADIIAGEVSAAYPECKIVNLPIHGVSESSAEMIISNTGGKMYQAQVISPDDRQITANYGITAFGTAIIEMAQSSGITQQIGLHPMTSSTYGLGQVIMAAIQWGARDFVICLKDSATTDGGCGMAAALGVRFLDEDGNSFIPCGDTLGKIASIDTSGIDMRITWSKFTLIRDVDTPLLGKNGASYADGPKKGANSEQVIKLDEGLRHLGTLLHERFGKDFSDMPGAGAAGGLSAGCMAFLGASLVGRIELMIKLCGFKKKIAQADLIITGEGKLDLHSFRGKTLSRILQNAGKVPVWSICGVCEYNETLLCEHNLIVFETREGISIEESMNKPAKYLRNTARRAVQYMKTFSQDF